MQAPRRRRRPHSCEECRRRKVKCDRNEPCGHCVLSRNPCVYNTRLVDTVSPLNGPNLLTYLPAPHAVPEQVSETDSTRALSTFQQPETERPSTLVSAGEVESHEEHPPSTRLSRPPLNRAHDLNELTGRVRTLEQLLSIWAPSWAVTKLRRSGSLNLSDFKDVSRSPQDRRVALNKSRLYETHSRVSKQ